MDDLEGANCGCSSDKTYDERLHNYRFDTDVPIAYTPKGGNLPCCHAVPSLLKHLIKSKFSNAETLTSRNTHAQNTVLSGLLHMHQSGRKA